MENNLIPKELGRFQRDVKLSIKRRKDISKLEIVVALLCTKETLPEKYKDHPLKGKYIGSRDCHIEPDWILIYRATEEFLYLERLGSHSDLF